MLHQYSNFTQRYKCNTTHVVCNSYIAEIVTLETVTLI